MVRGKKRSLLKEVPQLHQEAKFNIHNRFDIEVIDSVTGEVKQKAFAENIVLNSFWTRLLSPNTYFNYIHYGTGTGTMDANRTSLFSFLGSKAAGSKSVEYNWSSGWISSRKECQIAENENVGSELKEVGIGYGSAVDNLITHALLKDMNGNAISIVKTNTDIINIYSTVFLYFNSNGYDNNSIKLYPAPYNSFVHYLLGDYSNGQISEAFCFSSYPVHCSENSSFKNANNLFYKAISLTYSSSEKKITSSTVRLGASEAISDELIYMSVGQRRRVDSIYCKYPFLVFKPGGSWFEKSDIIGEAIGTGDGNTINFRTKYPFVKPGWKIYVDGTEQLTGVTIIEGLPFTANHMGKYFEILESVRDTDANGYSYGGIFDAALNCNMDEGLHEIGYNPLYFLGIDSIRIAQGKLLVSDNLLDWELIKTSTLTTPAETFSIPVEHKLKKYWKFIADGSWGRCGPITSNNTQITSQNIIFDIAPPSGAIITADYCSEVIAKDANHVFDFSFEITLGEKTS